MILTLTLNPTVDRVLAVPGFRPGGVRRAELLDLIPAGKGFNVSRVLAALGVPSTAAGPVGAAEIPLYRAAFGPLGVRLRLFPFPRPTRSNVTVIDPRAGTETHLRELGPAVPAGALARLTRGLFGRSRRAAGSAGVLAFCGSLPPGMGQAGLLGALRAARRSGRRLFVDSSGQPLRTAWRLRPEILSVNAEELAGLTGRPTDCPSAALAAARALLVAGRGADGPGDRLILVKLGARGALAVGAAGAWRAIPPAIRARNTVGAGDAFNAGFLAAESRGVPAALALAAACGAAQAASPALGRLDPARVASLARALRVETLAGKRG
ncbi:MAG TPA: PfkB family carbohydrate kinase [Planctomycetota bacterium]|nr:PfkB family carbohydrate kinase [Planctomycetota bacterium]